MKYTATCQFCQNETAINYEDWLSLTKVMLTFSGLTDAQKDTILLMIDGMKYRKEKMESAADRIHFKSGSSITLWPDDPACEASTLKSKKRASKKST